MSNTDFWPGLLKWSLAQTDGLSPASDIKPMSDEDKAFLNNALATMVVDEVKRIKIITAILKLPTNSEEGLKEYLNRHTDGLKALQELENQTKQQQEQAATAATATAAAAAAGTATTASESVLDQTTSSPLPSTSSSTSSSSPISPPDYSSLSVSSLLSLIIRKKVESFDELDDRVLTIDNANDLHHVGGLQHVINHLNWKEQKSEIVWRAAQVIATVTQNNPKSQQWAYEMNAVPALVQLLKESLETNSSHSSSNSSNSSIDNSDDESRNNVTVKALHALSQLVRSAAVPSLSAQFVELNGLYLLTSLLHSTSHKKSLVKLVSLLRFFLSSPIDFVGSTTRSLLITSASLNRLSEYISEDDINLREEVMKLIVGIVKKKEGIEEVKKEEYHIEKKVRGRIESLKKVSEEERETAAEELRQWNVVRAVCGW